MMLAPSAPGARLLNQIAPLRKIDPAAELAEAIETASRFPDDARVDPKLASAILATLGVSLAPHSLAVMRCTRSDGIPYSRDGKFIRYRVGDLRAYAEQRRNGTS